MIALVAAGAFAALGLVGLARAGRPAPLPSVPLRPQRGRLDGPTTTNAAHGASGLLGAPRAAAGRIGRYGFDLFGLGGRLRADIAVLATSEEVVAAELAAAFVAGPALMLAAWAVTAAAGAALPTGVTVAATLAAGPLLAVVALRQVRRSAARARGEMTAILTSYLSLVALGQAAGMGVEEALVSAAELPETWATERISSALASAALGGMSLWAGLERMGVEVGVPALVELAAQMALAGSEGAAVRESLTAKAAGLRTRALAEAEARANSTTELLSIPATVVAVGFMVFVAYPALTRVLGGL